MCLGEGTGAVAVLPLLDMGLCVYREMASFEAVKIDAYQPLA
ncbi:MAG: nicotinate-nucleotide--dimethylbenzimidazole phosphoribosyltransferase [Pseudoflavonifractor sp.]